MATRPVTPAAPKPLPSSCALDIEFQPDCGGNARGGLNLSDTLVISRTESVQCEAMSNKQAVMLIPQAETLAISETELECTPSELATTFGCSILSKCKERSSLRAADAAPAADGVEGAPGACFLVRCSELLRAERRLQRRVLVLAWETWVNAAAAAASVVAHQVIVRQHSERLQRRSVAAGFESWAGAADCRRQQRRLAKRAAARIRVCTLSAAWNGWADEAAAPAAEDEEDPSQHRDGTQTEEHQQRQQRTLLEKQMLRSQGESERAVRNVTGNVAVG